MPKKYSGKIGFRKYPHVEINMGNSRIEKGWESICLQLNREMDRNPGKSMIVVVETYQGVLHKELVENLQKFLKADHFVHASDFMFPEDEIKEIVFPDVTNDRIFGFLSRLTMNAFFDQTKIKAFQDEFENNEKGVTVVYGTGASILAPEPDMLIYADMARWEIQLRMRKHLVGNLGVNNRNTEDWMLLYKQGFFVDWRVCDRLKKKLYARVDYFLDTNIPGKPRMIEGSIIRKGLKQIVSRPFSVVPFFDPAPWGGQWMKEVCGLDPSAHNYGWCFNCVPEENSLLLKMGEDIIEIPSVNLVFMHPRELLGDPVHGRFGDEFPIRFDFLDTMGGGNLSLQIHPLTEYIQEKFGMHYTQDESYYMMDAEEDAIVYLGLKTGTSPGECAADLEKTQHNGLHFQAEKYVQTWPVKKHDHFLIPAGTIHCSGKNSMVLEISATPYIFTFKLWDWGRLGLDGKPRPINLEHGKQVIQWDRTTEWTRANLVNRIEKVAEGDGWVEERTGLHEREFIETHRYWFVKPIQCDTGGFEKGGVHVICLVEGDEIIVESPDNAFEPFLVYYAEVFIVPAGVGKYNIKPAVNDQVQRRHGIITAFVRQ